MQSLVYAKPFQNAGAPLANRYNAPRTIGANITYRW